MINPAEPNTIREIKFTYVTDANGELSINISTDGFDENPEAVALYISATIACLSEIETSDTIIN